MAATTDVSHGKRRPRALRPDRMPKRPAAELAAPYRDPATGQFGPGNPGGRLRQLAAIAKAEAEGLLSLPMASVAPWLRPHLLAAQTHAQRLVDALLVPTDELVALCGDEAKARMLSNAALTEGAREDCPPDIAFAWRKEAREWMREARQVVLTRKAVARETPPDAATVNLDFAAQAQRLREGNGNA
jgi:hypothetical protein